MNNHALVLTKQKIGGEKKTIRCPGSKSYTNRAVILSSMSPQKTILSGFLFSDDTHWGLQALKALGFSVDCAFERNIVTIDPEPIFHLSSRNLTAESITLFLGKAGTLARFFPAVLLNFQKTFPNYLIQKFFLTADEQLQKRPISDLCTAIKKLNGNISAGTWPIEISPSNLTGETIINGNVSGQFLSGLLLSAAGSKNKIKIIRQNHLVQPDYIRMTLAVLEKFNCFTEYTKDLSTFTLHQQEDLGANHYQIEPDASTACYFISLAVLHNFELTIENLGSDSIQPDLLFIDFLKKMGAHIEIFKNEIKVFRRNSTMLSGGFASDFNTHSDQALTAAILAIFADAPIEITGIAHIRNHECDRISSLVSNFKSLGIEIIEKQDGFIVFPLKDKTKIVGKTWKTFEDHRFAMCGFLLASMCENIRIQNPACVKKTAPDFFKLAENLGFGVEFLG